MKVEIIAQLKNLYELVEDDELKEELQDIIEDIIDAIGEEVW